MYLDSSNFNFNFVEREVPEKTTEEKEEFACDDKNVTDTAERT